MVAAHWIRDVHRAQHGTMAGFDNACPLARFELLFGFVLKMKVSSRFCLVNPEVFTGYFPHDDIEFFERPYR